MILFRRKINGFSLIELVIVVRFVAPCHHHHPSFQLLLKEKQQSECDQVAFQIKQMIVEYILEGAYQRNYAYPLTTKLVDNSDELENNFQPAEFAYFMGKALSNLKWQYYSDYRMTTEFDEITKKAIVQVTVNYQEKRRIDYTFELTEAETGEYDTAIILSFIYHDPNGCQKELIIQ